MVFFVSVKNLYRGWYKKPARIPANRLPKITNLSKMCGDASPLSIDRDIKMFLISKSIIVLDWGHEHSG